MVVDISLRPRQLPVHSSRKGVLSETAVLAQARNHGYWPFRLCFEQGLRKAAKLRGKTRIHVVVGADGRVRDARVKNTELDDREVATCLAAHAEQLHFSPPPPRRLGLALLVDLSPGDAPLPGLRLPETDGAPAVPLDARRLGELLGTITGPAGACYAKALTSDPALWGRIGVRVDVDRHGNVTVREHESRFPGARVVTCVKDAVAALPIASAMSAPGSFTWGLRFGSPQPPAAAPIPGEISLSTSTNHSKVAESPDTRLPLAR
ncbi:MAG TPA: AgmX/PglI C-terminal domain-containing protein [Polyangiaceae bacterium]|nr:AgmX/PglI C-terminal domain-containing protein [Polyangiaceae bacterium]